MCEREGRMKAIEFDGFLHIDCAGDWIASNHIPKFFFVECVQSIAVSGSIWVAHSRPSLANNLPASAQDSLGKLGL
jgi:hypothetical protein